MRVHLKTLGCRLNEAELETWAQQLQADGHQIVRDAGDADLVILNSCAVTQDAVKKSRYLIRRVHRENPRAKLVVSGCYATLDTKEVAESLGVDLVVSNADKARLVEIAREQLALDAMPRFSTEPGETSLFALGRQRAFVKVQDGCRYRCSFCIVTVARGEERSRSVAEILWEINTLHDQGVREVVLTGVHLGGYGSDLNLRLEHLIAEILEHTAIPRLRLGSLEPWELRDEFFRLWQDPRLMPHLHLPLQSGCDSVLKRMARRCKTGEFKELLERARQAVPDINITTDIIVGFPGETESEWESGLQFIADLAFGHIHIFNYSVRAGTKAAGLPNHVPEHVKKLRSQSLQRLAMHLKRQTFTRFLGRAFPVLWEDWKETDGGRRFFGYTPNFLRVETLADCGRRLSSRVEPARLSGIAPGGDHLMAELVPH
jgi:threonylcarbamoyladenosine tRNA methylthiotransferase MtaB